MESEIQNMIQSLSTDEPEATFSLDQRLQEMFGNLPFFLEDEEDYLLSTHPETTATGAAAVEATVEAPPNTPEDLNTPEPSPAPPSTPSTSVPIQKRNCSFWKPRRPTPYPRGRRVKSRQLTPPPESVSRRPRSKYISNPNFIMAESFSIYSSKNTESCSINKIINRL